MQCLPGFCHWADQVREALAGKSMEERSDTSLPPQCQNARVGTAIFWLKRGSVTEVQQIPSCCMNQHQSQLTLPQLLLRARASAAQPRRSRKGPGLARSRSTGRGVPFYHSLTFLMRTTICAYRHEPKLLLKPKLQRALRQSNLACLVLGSAVYLAELVQSLSQVSQSFTYTVCASFRGQCQLTLIL